MGARAARASGAAQKAQQAQGSEEAEGGGQAQAHEQEAEGHGEPAQGDAENDEAPITLDGGAAPAGDEPLSDEDARKVLEEVGEEGRYEVALYAIATSAYREPETFNADQVIAILRVMGLDDILTQAEIAASAEDGEEDDEDSEEVPDDQEADEYDDEDSDDEDEDDEDASDEETSDSEMSDAN